MKESINKIFGIMLKEEKQKKVISDIMKDALSEREQEIQANEDPIFDNQDDILEM